MKKRRRRIARKTEGRGTAEMLFSRNKEESNDFALVQEAKSEGRKGSRAKTSR